MASASDLCDGCKTYQEIVYHEEGTLRAFCRACAIQLPPSSEELAQLFLDLTLPFKVGDKVLARQVMACDGREIEFRIEGTGQVIEVSTDLAHGGTPVYPTFCVRIDEKDSDEAPDEAWYCEMNLSKVSS
jgi:hypothetical protein